MTAGFDPVSDVRAPLGAVAWTPSMGWLEATEDVNAATEAGDQPWLVDPDGIVRGVTAPDTVALAMLLDRRITGLRRSAEEADREVARHSAEIGARLSEYGDRMDEIGDDVDDVRTKLLTAAEQLAQALSERGDR